MDETQICEQCGEECDFFVSTGLDMYDGNICEHCADILTEEYSL